MTARPDRSEAAEYDFMYINQVGEGDIRAILERQGPEIVSLLHGIDDDRSLHRYAPDKWSIRQVVSHVNDAERLFLFRAFWFARGFDEPLPSFEQDIAVANADATSDPGAATSTSSRRFAPDGDVLSSPAGVGVETARRGERLSVQRARARVHHRRPRGPSRQAAARALSDGRSREGPHHSPSG